MLCCRSCQRGSLPRHVSPCYAIFSPTGHEQFPFFTNSSSFWEQRVMEERLPSSLPSISLPTQQSTLRTNSCARLPPACPARRSSSPATSGSRGGRPVSAKPIVKQNPKIYLPVSSPSPMSKHSNRSRKNAVAAIFAHDDFHRCRATSSAAKI